MSKFEGLGDLLGRVGRTPQADAGVALARADLSQQRFGPSRSGFKAVHFAAVLAVIVLIGISIRLLCARNSLWIDEIASFHFAHQPLSHLWTDWMRRETNPPLYYTALKGWMALTGGESDQQLRLLSLVYGCGAIGVAGLLGKKIAGPWAGLAAAALMAVSPSQVHYSVEVRAFAQSQFGALIALFGAISFLSASTVAERRAALGLYVAGAVVAIYSHTTLLLMPVLINIGALVWLWRQGEGARRQWPGWIGANLLILLAAGWWLSITIWQMSHARNLDWIGLPTLAGVTRQLLTIYGPAALIFRAAWLDQMATLLASVIMIAALATMAWRYRRAPALLLVICAVGAPVALFLLSFVKPVMIPRAFFWAGGPLMLCIAIGLASIANRKVALTLLGLLLAISFAGTASMVDRADGEPFKQIVEDLAQHDPSAVVIANSMDSGLALQRYCRLADCSLDIRSVAGPETWTRDIAMPRIAETAIPALLACAGKLYTVQRSFGAEKMYVPADMGTHHNLSSRYGPANYLKVARLDSIVPTGAEGRSGRHGDEQAAASCRR